MATGIVLIVYGLIAQIEGIIGFKSTGLREPLIAGSLSGGMLVLAGLLVLIGIRGGGYIALGTNLALIVVFGRRYAKTRSILPAGLMLGISSIVAGILVTQLFG